MGRGKEYSPRKRACITSLYMHGMPAKVVALKENVPINSIYGIVRRYQTQDRGRTGRRPGRPQVLSLRAKRLVLRIVDQNPWISNAELKRQAGLTCHVATVAAYLKTHGIQRRVALVRPKLNEVRAAARLAAARRWISKGPLFWRRWIFSDESAVQRGHGQRRRWCWIPDVRLTLVLMSWVLN